jgi:hypothetical protein
MKGFVDGDLGELLLFAFILAPLPQLLFSECCRGPKVFGLFLNNSCVYQHIFIVKMYLFDGPK